MDVTARAYDPAYIPQYASGTRNAAPGLALVGEQGPELVYFNGGEKVMTAAETSAFQAKASPEIQMLTLAPRLAAAMNAASRPDAGETNSPGIGAVSARVSAGSAPLTISVPVSVQVQGSAGPDTLEALRSWGDRLAETVTQQVMDALENARADAVRGAF